VEETEDSPKEKIAWEVRRKVTTSRNQYREEEFCHPWPSLYPTSDDRLPGFHMKLSRKDSHFVCHDLECSAFLWARGVKFLGIDLSPTPNNPNRVAFHFYDPNELCRHELIAFRNGAAIHAQQYAVALKLLKDQVLRRILR
jgi:hypothetical protein